MSGNKPTTPVTEAFRKNCEIRKEVLVELKMGDTDLAKVDCSKLEAPNGITLQKAKQESERLERIHYNLTHPLGGKRP